jgi:hypothetical protein
VALTGIRDILETKREVVASEVLPEAAVDLLRKFPLTNSLAAVNVG